MRLWAAIAGIVAVALVLRLRELEAFRLSPDDGNYMHSARLHVLERSVDPGRWIAEDKQWVNELAEDFGRFEGRTTYQHSYLHQFLLRYGYRLGLSRVEALRLNSAVLGALTSLFVFLFYRRVFPESSRIGLLAAALLAVNLMHAFLSRTGWGQTGCTAFFVLMFASGFDLLVRVRDDDARGVLRAALGVAVSSVLAYGFQEMIAVHVAVFGAIALALPWLERDGASERPASLATRIAEHVRMLAHSRRFRAACLAAIPVACLTLALYFKSEFARQRWFTPTMYERSWFEARRMALDRWFTVSHVEKQLGLALIAAACFGVVGVWKRDRRYARYTLAWLAGSFGVFFLVFNDPSLERIYLPAVVLLVILAAEGMDYVYRELTPPAMRRTAIAALVLLLGFSLARTWITLFGSAGNPLFEPGVYVGKVEARYSDRPMLDVLRERDVHEVIGVDRVKEPLFSLIDAGYSARLFDFGEPEDRWPEYLVGVVRLMEADRRTVATGGRYAPVAVDTTQRLALYQRTAERGEDSR